MKDLRCGGRFVLQYVWASKKKRKTCNIHTILNIILMPMYLQKQYSHVKPKKRRISKNVWQSIMQNSTTLRFIKGISAPVKQNIQWSKTVLCFTKLIDLNVFLITFSLVDNLIVIDRDTFLNLPLCLSSYSEHELNH